MRDGLQYQCIGCALCVDACDSIMEKLDKPKGLIRYTTENELEGQTTHLMRPRLVGYAVVLLAMISGFSYAMMTRTPFELDIERDRGSLYQVTPNDTVENYYTLKMMHMTQQPQTYLLRVEGIDGVKMDIATEYQIPVNKVEEMSLTLEVDPDTSKLSGTKTLIEFVVVDKSSGIEVAREESRFIAPRL
jgi:polyferredoxin